MKKERKENSEEEATRGGQDASETVVCGAHGVSSAWGLPARVVLAQNTTRSLLFFILCNLTPPTKPSRRERERERSTSAGFYPKYPRTRKEAWADSATDPPSSQWTLIIGEVPRRFPRFSRGSSSNHRDLPIVEFDVSICWFEGTVFTTWNVSIHKLRHRVSESPGSPRVDSFLFFFLKYFAR